MVCIIACTVNTYNIEIMRNKIEVFCKRINKRFVVKTNVGESETCLRIYTYTAYRERKRERKRGREFYHRQHHIISRTRNTRIIYTIAHFTYPQQQLCRVVLMRSKRFNSIFLVAIVKRLWAFVDLLVFSFFAFYIIYIQRGLYLI